MARLSSSTSISGSSNVSSLIRSASSLRTQINTYNDTQARLVYENSAKTDDDLTTYLSYLKGRVDTLSSTGSIADATKAMDMQQTMITATHANISASIQRENINVMAGNATPQDKLNLIQQQYSRAIGIGDQALAQSLESQAYSLSQTIQVQQQDAVKNAETISNANDSALKKGYNNALDAVKGQMTDILTAYKTGNEAAVTQALKGFGATYKELTGNDLPKGTGLNMGSALQAYFNAAYAYNTTAAKAFGVQYDANGNVVPGSGDANGYGMTFAQNAHNIVTAKDSINVPGVGQMNAHDALAWANSPDLFGTKTNDMGENQFVRNRITGYQYVNGVLTPTSDGQTGSVYGSLDKGTKANTISQLQKLGLSVKESNGELTATFTAGSDKWTQFGKGNGSLKSSSEAGGSGNTVSLIPLANGGFQFLKDGQMYTIATDAKGLSGIFLHSADGGVHSIAGQYGFNQKVNTMVNNATVQQLQAKTAQAQQVALDQQHAQAATMIKTMAATGQALPGIHPVAPGSPSAVMTQRAGGGFNFTNNGAAISAAQYAKLTNTPFRTLLQTMAAKGDSGAQTALGFVGNDYGYDPTKSTSYENGNLYNSLTWGVGVKPITQGVASASVLGNGAQLSY